MQILFIQRKYRESDEASKTFKNTLLNLAIRRLGLDKDQCRIRSAVIEYKQYDPDQVISRCVGLRANPADTLLIFPTLWDIHNDQKVTMRLINVILHLGYQLYIPAVDGDHIIGQAEIPFLADLQAEEKAFEDSHYVRYVHVFPGLKEYASDLLIRDGYTYQQVFEITGINKTALINHLKRSGRETPGVRQITQLKPVTDAQQEMVYLLRSGISRELAGKIAPEIPAE